MDKHYHEPGIVCVVPGTLELGHPYCLSGVLDLEAPHSPIHNGLGAALFFILKGARAPYKPMKILRHLQAILLLPLMVTVVIPWLLLSASAGTSLGWSLAPPLKLLPLLLGCLLIGLGFTLVGYTVSLFFNYGEGTLAPWTPTQKLVVRGIYRHVRNPMISCVCAVLLGEALLFGAVSLLYWFSFVLLLNMIYLPLVEEPGLEERFGADYLRYKQNVPRWIPRLRPWRGLEALTR